MSQPSNIIDDRSIEKKSTNIHTQASEEKTTKHTSSLNFISFVIIKGIIPVSNFALWQLNLIRTIFSPQTWFLLSLPLLFVQLRIIQNYNLNEILQKSRDFLSPEHYNVIVVTLCGLIAAFLIGIIIRAIITNTGIYVRLREIDDREVQSFTGLKIFDTYTF
jgi:hypothetical protein